ncbi:hypothetical protein D3C76_1446280 [compost metagenome]
MRRQGIDVDPDQSQLRPPLVTHHQLSAAALQPAGNHQAVIQLTGQLPAQMITTAARPAHRHGQCGYRRFGTRAPGAFQLDTGQGLHRRPDLRGGQAEVALAAPRFMPEQSG